MRVSRFKVLSFTLCLLLLGLSNISTVFAEAGGSNGGGGGNDFEAKIHKWREILQGIFQNDTTHILTLYEQKILLSEIDTAIVMDFETKEGEGIDIQKTSIRLAPEALKVKYGILNSMATLKILMKAYAKHFSNPEEIEDKMQRLFEMNINFPEFLKVSMQTYVSTNRGCRDEIKILTNPMTGVVSLVASSTASCVLENAPEQKMPAYFLQKIQSPSVKYQCQRGTDKKIVCSALNRQNTDFDGCFGDLLQNIKQWPTLTFLGDSIDVHYFWCAQVDDDVYKRTLDKSYRVRSQP